MVIERQLYNIERNESRVIYDFITAAELCIIGFQMLNQNTSIANDARVTGMPAAACSLKEIFMP